MVGWTQVFSVFFFRVFFMRIFFYLFFIIYVHVQHSRQIVLRICCEKKAIALVKEGKKKLQQQENSREYYTTLYTVYQIHSCNREGTSAFEAWGEGGEGADVSNSLLEQI